MTALRIVEFADITNTGRVRRNNEDSYLVEPPLFVLADGMGGAQAGEVASRLDDRGVRRRSPTTAAAEERLRGTISEANRRVVERGRSRPEDRRHGLDGHGRAGRGRVRGRSGTSATRAPTCCAGGQFQQLSHDHSLVGELVRQGRITVEEAGSHPQRSVITRALGAEPTTSTSTPGRSRPRTATSTCSAPTASPT